MSNADHRDHPAPAAPGGRLAAGNLGARLAQLSPEKRALLERRLRGAETPASTGRILPRQTEQCPPLSFAQQRLWFLEQLEPGQAFYNLPLVKRFGERVVPAALSAALNEIVRRHESLRTSFRLQHGEPVQQIAEPLELPLELIDISDMPAELREAEAGRCARAEALRPFDLGRGPLIRALLLQLDDCNALLVVTMHHIISDGWSLAVLSRELDLLYAAFRAGKPSPLPPLPMQYGDFAIWQRDSLQGEHLQRLLAYWRAKLADMPALLELPTDAPRPRTQTFHGGTIVQPYDRPTIVPLKALAARHEATLFMALLAAFKVLLHRFSGITDMVVGSPIAGRDRTELEGLIGFFVNTLVLRVDLSGDPSFRQVLARVRETTLEAYAHQELPFERLVEELSPSRNLSHNPLFQVMFGLQNAETAMASHNSRGEFSAGHSKFDLTLSASETAEGLTCIFEFNTAIFRSDTILALAEAFGVVMREAARAPDRPIAELPLLQAAQRARLIVQATTPGPAPRENTVHRQFERQADTTPDAIAVATSDITLSYAEVEARANRLAHELVARGAKPDGIVGLCLDRGIELPIAMLAILKAGAAFLPLDPSHPPDRLDYMLGDAKVRILVTSTRLLGVLPAFDGELICLDRDETVIAQRSGARLPQRALPEHLAYVIYTSGSTGRPKGVMVTHRGASNCTQTLIEAFHLPPSTRVLQFGSLSFDISIYDLLMVIGCGGTLCMAPAAAIMPGPPLAETLAGLRINAITLPPSALAVVPVTDLPDLQLIVCGGELLSGELAARWARGRRVIDAYGPTETTIWATYFPCSGDEPAPPIGRAISRVAAHVLDERLEPVPPGFPGEIFIGGAGVARGYLGRPDLTAERYLPDPLSAEPGARLYRTGDRARRRASGDIAFIARLDHQIKLRGYRIELGEIEAVLRAHPAVGEAAAVIQQTPGGERRIAAFCTTPQRPASRAELLQHLRKTLPDFMIPANLGIVEALPVNAAGKLDRRQLAARLDPDAEAPGDSIEGTELERRLAAIIADVLELKRVGPRDSFFDLGGHSLLATRAMIRINEAFQVALPLRDIFEFPVIADLASAIERARQRDDRALPAITRAERRPVLLSAQQEEAT